MRLLLHRPGEPTAEAQQQAPSRRVPSPPETTTERFVRRDRGRAAKPKGTASKGKRRLRCALPRPYLASPGTRCRRAAWREILPTVAVAKAKGWSLGPACLSVSQVRDQTLDGLVARSDRIPARPQE